MTLPRPEAVLFGGLKSLGCFHERGKTKISQRVDYIIGEAQADHFKDKAIREYEFIAFHFPVVSFQLRNNAK
jgi:hypothetical protein